jgi:hypothetical protein
MEVIMASRKTRWVTAVVIALGMANVSVTGKAAEAEAAPVFSPQPLINRDQPSLSETEGRIAEREQLRRYFQQGLDRLRL